MYAACSADRFLCVDHSWQCVNLVLVNIPQVIHPCDFVEVAVDPQVIEVSDADTPIPVKILPHLQRFAGLGKPSPVVPNALAWITDADKEAYIVLDPRLAGHLTQPRRHTFSTCISTQPYTPAHQCLTI